MANLFSRLCAFLLPLLGVVTSCDPGDNYCEYGVPTADFEIKGRVTDTDSNPVKGIRITADAADSPAATETGTDGTFEISFTAFPSDKVDLLFSDVDGPENGEFVSKTETVHVSRVEDSGDGWYSGRYSAENVTVVMDNK